VNAALHPAHFFLPPPLLSWLEVKKRRRSDSKRKRRKKFKGRQKATTRKIHELAGGETNWIAFHIYVYIYTIDSLSLSYM
jgi:hypothetical protein